MSENYHLDESKKEEIIRARDKWEPVGHTPMPDIPDLHNWDMRLLKTYKPFYPSICDQCGFFVNGKCTLPKDKREACAIDASPQIAKAVLKACCMGTSAHCAHARYIIDHMIDRYGAGHKVSLGDQISVEAPNIRLVLGMKAETLGDLEKAITYVEGQLIDLISSLHATQDRPALGWESRALHVSMLDHVAMEAADIAEIVGLHYPASVADTPLVELGWGTVDRTKPVILLAGDNPSTGVRIAHYLKQHGLQDKVELVAICSAAHGETRSGDNAKVIGPLSRQLIFVRCAIADVVVTHDQCVSTDMPGEAARAGSAFIATSDKAYYGLEDLADKGCYGLEELTDSTPDEIVTGMTQNGKQALILDLDKVAEVAVRVALELAPRRDNKLRKSEEMANMESGKLRVGRGPIMDTEIRKVGAPLVLGTIPGVIAIVGCSDFPGDTDVLAEIAEEFAKRKYIVVLSGCAAMAVGMKKDKEGKSLYEKYSPTFEAGGVINLGSCMAYAHVSGAAIKIANIFSTLPLRGNYEVIADYIMNRVGACGLGWGAYFQKSAAIATGFNRLGIPVVLGPDPSKYGRLYMSNKEDSAWTVMDGRERRLVDTGEPSPEHLCTVAESKESAMIMLARLCIRKNDTPQGRQLKLTHYIGLHKQYMGGLPEDLSLFVRKTSEIPIFFKKEVIAYLEKVGWKEKPIISLPTLIGTYDSDVSLDSVIH